MTTPKASLFSNTQVTFTENGIFLPAAFFPGFGLGAFAGFGLACSAIGARLSGQIAVLKTSNKHLSETNKELADDNKLLHKQLELLTKENTQLKELVAQVSSAKIRSSSFSLGEANEPQQPLLIRSKTVSFIYKNLSH